MTRPAAFHGTWTAIDRHAKHRKFVLLRAAPDGGAETAIARWNTASQQWEATDTGAPLGFTPTEYLRT